MDISYFELAGEHSPIPCKLSCDKSSAPRRVVVGVHGFAGDKESSVLSALAAELAVRGDALICFDFPAHGNSRANDDMLTVDNCISDLLTVVRHAAKLFPGCRISIFATSFGGYITLLSAEKLSVYVSDIILRAPAVRMDEVFPKVLPRSISEYDRSSFFETGFERKMLLPYSFYEDLKNRNAFDIPLSIPAMIICAADDELVPYQTLVEYAAKNNAVRIDIPGATHRFKGEGELEKILNISLDFLYRTA